MSNQVKSLIDSTFNPMDNSIESRRLRIKSMMSYEGYEEYYNQYADWCKSTGQTPQPKMDRVYFNKQLNSMSQTTKDAILNHAIQFGVPVPKSFNSFRNN